MRRIIAFIFLLFMFHTSLLAQLDADFIAVTNTSGCAPLIVQFSDQSTGNPVSWSWNFGNGNTSTNQNPSAVYSNPGTYNVSLTVSDGTGSSTEVKNAFITVNALPTPAFTASPTTGCAPLTVSFTDQSVANSGTINSWTWDFGDGTISTQQNPTHTYNAVGNYTVTLVVRNSFNCNSSIAQSNFIQVTPFPQANFSIDSTFFCEVPATVNFTNLSTGPSATSYFWDFGDGNTSTDENPVHTYTTQGTFDVTLLADDGSGCVDTMFMPSAVTTQDYAIDFTADDTLNCIGDSFQFTSQASGSPSVFLWNFGNGQTSAQANPTISYNAEGLYDVSLNVTYPDGCTQSLEYTEFVEVLGNPQAGFTVSDSLACEAPFTVQFTDNSVDAVDWLWDFGDGNTSTDQNPVHTYLNTGTYSVSLTVSNIAGCSNSTTESGLIQIVPPQASFTIDVNSGCAPLEVNFNNTSSSAFFPIADYNWTFGDGSVSIDTSPVHTYLDTGFYQPTLTIETINGCIATFNGPQIAVGDTPVVNFAALPLEGCYQQSISFFDSSSIGVNSWFWDFGDGNTSTEQFPSNIYEDIGVFDITLIASFNGCADTLVFADYITISPPIPEFDYTVSCDSFRLFNFIDESDGANQWLWNFGDGNTSTEQNPQHFYVNNGSYTVNLIVWDTISGCQQNISQTVQATVPTASLTSNVTSGCYPLTVNFTNTSQFRNQTSWYIPSGTFHSGATNSTSYTFTQPGNYDVTMINCDVNGCCDTLVLPNYIQVYGTQPNFTANPTIGCPPLTTNFNNTTVAPNSTVASWSWNFGDGNTSTAETPTHTYQNPGVYTVVLTVTDTFGCTNSRTRNNYIRVTKPRPSFTLADSIYCLGQDIQFTNTSQTTNNATYSWDFGDGNTSTAQNPVHSYNSYGSFDVTLTVVDNNGCDSTITINNAVLIEDPVVDFVSDTAFATCPPLLVNFIDSSSYALPAVGWQWDFGNNSSSTNQNSSIIYSVPGSYDVTLITTFSNGCVDSITKPQFIEILGPTADIDFNPNFGCPPLDVFFEANSQNAVDIIWDFGDGNVEFAGDTITHTYWNTGTFTPLVILTDSSGCVFVEVASAPIQIDTPFAGFYSDVNFVCAPAQVSFFDTSASVIPVESYLWDFGDGNTDTVQNPQHWYDTSGTFTVSLTITNIFGCSNVILKDIVIFPQPEAAFTVSDTIVCDPALLSFQNLSSADTSISVNLWNFGDNTISILENPQHAYATEGFYNVSLIVTDDLGCSDTATQEIIIYPEPDGLISGDTAICFGDTVNLFAQSGDSLYIWTPNTGISNPSIFNPDFFPDTTTQYFLEVINSFGCSKIDSLTLQVNPLPSLQLTQDTAICFGDTVQLNAVGGISFDWSPPSGLSNPGIENPLAFPNETTTYFVVNTDTNNCENRDSVIVTVNRVIASFEEPIACLGDTVFFMDESVSLNGTVNSWLWDFDDNSPNQTDQNPIHFFNVAGTYNVSLTVTDTDNCTHDTIVPVNASPLPAADFTLPVTICQNNEAEFFENASGPVAIVDWLWDFGDGSSVISDPNPTFTYTDNGNFTISLVVIDLNGCRDTITETVFVNPQPEPIFTTSNVCDGVSVEFENFSAAVVPIVDYDWSFGDNNTSGDFEPVHLYSGFGTYTVNLMVTDSMGCVASFEDDVTVYELPTAGILLEDVCLGDFALLADNSIEGDGQIQNYIWNTGDGSNSFSDINPTYFYADSGFYNVNLIVIDEFGCSDTTTSIQRVDIPATAFAFPDTLICEGDEVQLFGGNGDSIFWEPAEYLDNPESATPIANPPFSTVFTLFTTNGVCPYETATVNVEVKPLPFVETIEDREILWGTQVELNTVTDPDVVSISWSPADSLSCIDCLSPFANPETTTTYTIEVTDGLGCINSDQVTLDVIVRCDEDLVFVPNTFTPDGDGVNDILYARLFGVKEIRYFRVYNRWGELLFETNDHNVGWRGTDRQGRKLNSGVYVYSVEAVCYNGQTFVKKGNVTLLK
ncbi:MAG: PKD domain-containing protein [Chitinophagaceae bacterium]|nr:MAG: PKD domain-containing protein [Chitinophagaceae bacterium]